MMKLISIFVAVLLTLASSAGALKMSIWDREMQTTLGVGESSGNKFNVQLVKSYNGPVVILFSQTDEEKRSGTFTSLQNRYDGILKNGQLTIMNADDGPASATTPDKGTTATSSTKLVSTSLGKLLQPFRLNVAIQLTGQSNLPDNWPRAPEADGNGNGGNNGNGKDNGRGNAGRNNVAPGNSGSNGNKPVRP